MIFRTKLFYAMLGIACCCAAACGGGGGGGDDGTSGFGDDNNRNVSGTWQGALTLLRNDCNLTLPGVQNASHTVNQNGQAVVLVTESQVQHVGNIVGDNGFSVNAVLADNAADGDVTCDTSQQIEYDGIDDDESDDLDDLTDESDGDGNVNTATVTIDVTRTCSNNTTCMSMYRGVLQRGSGPPPGSQPTPTPAPGATPPPTPNPDGISCQSVRERSYTGDAGCGISEVSLDRSGTTVVLEPFGVNGATSFTPVAGDATQAQSSRLDLTIKTVPGYNCSIQCNGEITFEVKCFLEGAESCTEKF